MLTAKDFLIPTLGTPKLDSPLTKSAFVSDDERVLYRTDVNEVLREAKRPARANASSMIRRGAARRS